MRFCREGWIRYQRENKIVTKKQDNEGIKAMIKLLDIVLRKHLLATKPLKCFTCDMILTERELQVGHFISRKNMTLRWDLQNVELQCENCNCFLHGNLREYESRLSEERKDYLNKHKHSITRMSESKLMEIFKKLKELNNGTNTNYSKEQNHPS